MGLCTFEDLKNWELLDEEVIKRKQLNYYDHLRIATGFGLLGLGSESFWSFFVQHLVSIENLSPDMMTQSLLTLSKQCYEIRLMSSWTTEGLCLTGETIPSRLWLL